MNKEAYDKTVETGKVTFFSRTKNRLWTKGEESGNFLNVVSIKEDCDQEHYRLFIFLAPTCIRTCMANWSHRVYLNQQCILITVFLDRNDIQEITTLLTFRPKTVLGAAEEK